MTYETKDFIFRFLNDDILVVEIEQWICNARELEAEQSTLYQDLILADFGDNNAKDQLKSKLAPYVDKREFDIWRFKSLLHKIVDDQIDIVLATRQLQELYLDTGEKLILATLGAGFASELDDVPVPVEYPLWDAISLKEKLKKVDLYKDEINVQPASF